MTIINDSLLHLDLSLPEINLLLESLGHMPYGRVHELVRKIHQQSLSQLSEKENIVNDRSLNQKL